MPHFASRFYHGKVLSFDEDSGKHQVLQGAVSEATTPPDILRLLSLWIWLLSYCSAFNCGWQICYDDGEDEVLCLSKERWEMGDVDKYKKVS